MSAQRIYDREIINYLQAFIKAEFPNTHATLPLKLVQKGGLDVFPNAAALADQLPALFIRSDHDEQDDVDGEVNYRIIYYFEMIYVKKVVLTTQVEDLLMRDVNLINELLINNTNLPGYSSGGQIESATVKGVNYNNAYNTGLNMLNPVLRAVVLNIQIKHLTRR